MPAEESRRYRAGESVEDRCRVCKIARIHSVITADSDGRILRVICDYCHSQHNYRGGGAPAGGAPASAGSSASREALPLVSGRERGFPIVSLTGSGDEEVDLELMLRRVIREESGLTAVTPAEKWRGGEMVLRPGKPGVQEKSWPIESFFHKVVMLRNRLRVLEQHINAAELPDELKLKLQSYITGCYGTLTSFNVLFAEEDDRFRGVAGKD